MPVITSAVVTSIVRVLAPVVNDLYKGAKGEVKKNLDKWNAQLGVRKITRVLAKVESVKTIWSPDKESLLSEFYYPSKVIVYGARVYNKAVARLSDLPPGNFIVQGTVGQGKSIFMRYLASSLIRDESAAAIPIFLEFRNVTTKRTLPELIQKYLESIGVVYSDETFAYLASSGRLVILLDGFDELSEDCTVDTIQDIESLQVRFPEVKLLISSRPKNEIQKISGFNVIKLLPLRRVDYDPFLKKLNITPAKRVELIDAIASSPSNVSDIIQTPLMLTLVVLVYQTDRVIPPTLAEFFESLFQVVFTKHDRLKAGFYRKHHSGLSERNLQRLFEAFCFMVIQLGFGRTLKGEEFNSAFDFALEYAEDCKCEVENFKKDIVKVACLMLEEGLDLTTFLHKSIMDYHAAAFIKRTSSEVAALFYDAVSGDAYKRWRSVLSFLESIDSYRYSQEYVLPRLPQLLSELDALLLERNDSQLVGYVSSRHPDFIMTYTSHYFPNGFESMAESSDVWEEVVDLAILETLTDFEDLDTRVDILKETFGEPSNDGVTSDGREINISSHRHLELFGTSAMWKSLSEASGELHQMLQKASLAVKVQDKKKLIFQRKPKPGV